ncbi:unnamed protein product [Owenia fusiformis]|uniref:Glycosyltransferase family 92 protein n=1 Tax=Owenia fusiformis TaxID=6347 RepID=A0A8J1UMM9_OWEFU|nr:unnamed protein product [Owenia fusiformis]
MNSQGTKFSYLEEGEDDKISIEPLKFEAQSETNYTFDENFAARWPSSISWQKTKDSIEMYILSAFYDDRPSLGSRTAAVQVLALSEQPSVGVPAQGDIYCHLWGTSQKPLVVKAQRNLLGIERMKRYLTFHNKGFRSYIWSCKIKRDTKIPVFVSISYRTNITTSFMPVQIPTKPKVKQEFAVCQRYFGHVDPYLIIEMMELYKILGVSKSIIYITNLSPETSKVLLHYSQEGFMEVVDFQTPFENYPRFPPMHKPNHIRILQVHSYNDCMYRNMYKYKHIIFTDPDEIIIPMQHATYSDMMKEMKLDLGFDVPTPYLFKNVFFFQHFPQEESEPAQVRSLRFQTRLAPGNPFPAVIKVILDPMSCLGLHIHRCWVHTRLAKHNSIVKPSVALSFHYRKCHFELEEQGKCEQFLNETIRETAMVSFKEKLLPAMQQQVDALGLAPIG